MTFAQRRNHLTTHFSERIPVVKRGMTVLSLHTTNFSSSNLAVPSLRRLVALLSPLGPRCVHGRVHLRFSVQRVGPRTGISPNTSVPFHNCSIFVIIYILLLPVWKAGDVWEVSKKLSSVRKRGGGALNRKIRSLFKLFLKVQFISSSKETFIFSFPGPSFLMYYILA